MNSFSQSASSQSASGSLSGSAQDDDALALDSSMIGFAAGLAPRQRTLAQPVSCSGVGVHSGEMARLTLLPAAAGQGIVFVRTDLAGQPEIRAHFHNVHETRLRTELRNEAGASISTIEHLMAALVAAQIDNLRILVDAGEVPIMDGSAAPFAVMIEMAGHEDLAAARQVLRVEREVSVARGGSWARLKPQAHNSYHLQIDFGSHPALLQQFDFDTRSDDFRTSIAPARTFGFISDVEKLRAAGLARGSSLDNTLAYDQVGPVNLEGERLHYEAARHKILDAMGDLALAGYPILGRFEAEGTGHCLNRDLLQAMMESQSCQLITLADPIPPHTLAATANLQSIYS